METNQRRSEAERKLEQIEENLATLEDIEAAASIHRMRKIAQAYEESTNDIERYHLRNRIDETIIGFLQSEVPLYQEVGALWVKEYGDPNFEYPYDKAA